MRVAATCLQESPGAQTVALIEAGKTKKRHLVVLSCCHLILLPPRFFLVACWLATGHNTARRACSAGGPAAKGMSVAHRFEESLGQWLGVPNNQQLGVAGWLTIRCSGICESEGAFGLQVEAVNFRQ